MPETSPDPGQSNEQPLPPLQGEGWGGDGEKNSDDSADAMRSMLLHPPPNLPLEGGGVDGIPLHAITLLSHHSAEKLNADRRALRKQLVERRLALSADDCERLSAAVCAHLRNNFPQLAGMRVGFCWPVKNEPDLRPLMQSWIDSGNPGFTALLPVVIEADAALAFRAWTPESRLEADRYGIPAPVEGEFLVPEALLIPVNAFDAAGYRIGYGGGFFDRTLAEIQPVPLSVGVGFELSRVDSVCPQIHDMRLDAMVSEAGIFHHNRPNKFSAP